MKQSDDVAKLFTFFDRGHTGRYREIHETQQHKQTRERWPMFDRIHVGIDAGEEPGADAAAPSEPVEYRHQPKSFKSPQTGVFRTPSEPNLLKNLSGRPKSPLPRPPADASGPQPVAQVPAPAAHQFFGGATASADNMKQPSGVSAPPVAQTNRSNASRPDSLQAIFKRFERVPASTAPTRSTGVATDATPKSGSIRTFLDRLNRS